MGLHFIFIKNSSLNLKDYYIFSSSLTSLASLIDELFPERRDM